ncbi:MAG: ATP-binding protein [Spirochaetia bacterium]
MNIKSKIRLFIISSLIIITTVAGLLYAIVGARRISAESKENVNLIVSNYAEIFNVNMQNYKRITQDFSASVVVGTYIPEVFAEASRLYPEFEHIVYANQEARILHTYPYREDIIGRNISDEAYWQQAIVSGDTYISEINTDFGYPAIIFAAPVFSYFQNESEPNFHGTVLVTLPLEYFQQRIQEITIGETGSAFLINRNGEFLGHTDGSELPTGNLSQWSEYYGFSEIEEYLDGSYTGSGNIYTPEQLYLSFHPIPETDWFLIITQQMSELHKDLYNTILLLLIIFLISIGIAALVSKYAAKSIISPLQQNLDLLKSLAEGKTDSSKIQWMQQNDEFGEIAEQFNKVISNLNTIAKRLDIDLQREKQEKIRTVSALHDTQARFKAIFNQTFQYIWLLSPDGAILEANSTFLNSAGLERSGILQIDFCKAQWWINEKTKSIVTKNFNEARNGILVRFETEIHVSDSIHSLDFSLKPIFLENDPSEVTLIIAEGRDITQRKQMQAELEKHKNQLEVLVQERTQELEAAQAELIKKEKFSVLGQLTAIVSHEIRNPLGTIRSSAYILEKRSAKEDEKINRAITRIQRNVIRCDSIIEELLDYTRNTKVELVQKNIDQWIQDFIETYEKAEGIPITLDLHSEMDINFDPEQIRRVFINLIDNAVHAIQDIPAENVDSNYINISTENNGDSIRILISDTGSGISKENKEKIFEPLFSTKGFGVGLGLPIVKHIIDLHAGKIELYSETEKGTTFVITLPKEGPEI